MFRSKQDAADVFASIKRHLPHIAAQAEVPEQRDAVGDFVEALRGLRAARDREALDALADAMERQRRKRK